MTNRRCVGCGAELTGGFATREHVVAQWLAAEIRLPGVSLKHYLHDQAKAEDTLVRRHDLNNFAVKKICAGCNEGWMSRLEVQAKPLVLRLMRQQTSLRDLPPDARLVVSRWAVKTAFMILSVQQTKYELPWKTFEYLRINEGSGPDGCIVIGAQLAMLPEGLSYTCHPMELHESRGPVQFRVGFAINHLHLVSIIPILEGPRVARFDPNVHFPIWPPDVISIANVQPSNPFGFESVERMQDYLTGLVEAGIG
jgi:hypothetical protein